MSSLIEPQPARHSAVSEHLAQRTTTRPSTLLDAAHAYGRIGVAVFRCVYPIEIAGGAVRCCSCYRHQKCDAPGKHPVEKGGLQSASTNPALIEKWWAAGGRSNIGIATGSVSGLVVLDVDPWNG